MLIGFYYLGAQRPPSAASVWQPVFWLESVALWAFGISWFIKGETLFADPA